MKKSFHFRSFISFGLFFIIVYLLVSGTVLFISPPGRVAHWQHWIFLGFDKEQWQAQHTLFSYLFVILGIFHIFILNWRNLWSYVKLKSAHQFRKKKEFLTAILLFAAVFFGTSFNLPPLSSFYDLGKNIGFSWEEKQKSGPIPHAENLSLKEISENYLQEDIEVVIEKLISRGYSVKSTDQTLLEIASENSKSPADIYEILVPESKGSSAGGGSGKGYGRMTIQELADKLGLKADDLISILQSKGISARPKETIKDIAGENAMHPSEIVRMLQIEH